jgi:leucyl-tRNA synthetase
MGVPSRQRRETAEGLVLMIAPMAPFIAEELWRGPLGHGESVHRAAWPAFDSELATEATVTMVVQVDGRVRDRLEVPQAATEEECRALALASEKAMQAIGAREITRVVVRPPRLVNIVTAVKAVEAPV